MHPLIFLTELLSLLIVIKFLQDWHLALVVCLLVAIDCIILLLYDVIEGVNGNLVAQLEPNAENPQDITGVRTRTY